MRKKPGFNEIYLNRILKEQRKTYAKIAGWALILIGFIGAAGLVGKLVSMPFDNTKLERLAPMLTGAITASALVLSGAVSNYSGTFRRLVSETKENSETIRYFRSEIKLENIKPRQTANWEDDGTQLEDLD